MIDTGQYEALKPVISSPEAQQKAFDTFRERLKSLTDKDYQDILTKVND